MPHSDHALADATHPLIAEVRRLLKDRTHRDATGTFFVEGVRFLCRATERKVKIRFLVVSPLLTSPRGRALIQEYWQAGVPCVHVSSQTFAELSLLDQPQGVGAVVEQRWTQLTQASARQGLCWLAASRIRSPGNLGTILRTAEAVGAAGLLLAGDHIDPYDPTTVRATMGSIFGLHYVRTNLPDLRAWARRQHAQIVGASPAGSARYDRVRYRRPTVLWLGDERKGLSTAEERVCQRLVRIPMGGSVDSLNVSVAAGVLLYELLRRS